jgi:hypothetical protein
MVSIPPRATGPLNALAGEVNAILFRVVSIIGLKTGKKSGFLNPNVRNILSITQVSAVK